MNELEDIKALQDAGKRLADGVSLALLSETDVMDVVNKWMTFKLEDGSTNHVLYDTKDEAVRDMKGRSKDHCYLKITPDGITQKDACGFLRINRHPMIDTTAPEHVIGPQIFPRFSNLTSAQKAVAKAEAERQAKEFYNG